MLEQKGLMSCNNWPSEKNNSLHAHYTFLGPIVSLVIKMLATSQEVSSSNSDSGLDDHNFSDSNLNKCISLSTHCLQSIIVETLRFISFFFNIFGYLLQHQKLILLSINF